MGSIIQENKQMTNTELVDKIVIETQILKKCENTHHLECDFCEKWMDGIYCRSSADAFDDDWYCICGKCLLVMSCRFPFLHGINLMMKIDEIQPFERIKLPF